MDQIWFGLHEQVVSALNEAAPDAGLRDVAESADEARWIPHSGVPVSNFVSHKAVSDAILNGFESLYVESLEKGL